MASVISSLMVYLITWIVLRATNYSTFIGPGDDYKFRVRKTTKNKFKMTLLSCVPTLLQSIKTYYVVLYHFVISGRVPYNLWYRRHCVLHIPHAVQTEAAEGAQSERAHHRQRNLRPGQRARRRAGRSDQSRQIQDNTLPADAAAVPDQFTVSLTSPSLAA